MNQRLSTFQIDLILHGVLLAVQLLVLLPGGFLQNGTTPPLVFPCVMILATVTVFRQSEALDTYKSRLILIPSILSSLLYAFCLINEFTRDLWAFAQPRHFPVAVRILWYQIGLFLIHPVVFTKVWNGSAWFGRMLRERGYFGRKVWIPALIAAFIMWFFRSQNLSPDGYDWLRHSVYPKNWVNYLREPFGTFIFFLFVQTGMKFFHWDPYISITVLSILCGILSTLLLRRVFRYAVSKPFVTVSMALLLCSYGYTQIFTGNIEIYALLHAGLAVFLYCAVRYMENDWPVWIAGLSFGALFCLHLSAGWWIPAFLALPFLKQSVTGNKTRLPREFFRLGTGFLAFSIPFGLFVWLYGFNGNGTALWNHFWSDQVMNVGADAAMFRKPGAFLNINVYLAMINEYCCMMAGGVMLVFVLLASVKNLRNWTLFCLWTACLAGMYVIYSIVWNPDRHFPADWDIFSGMTVPVILLISQLLSRLPLRRETIYYLYYQSIVFSGLYLLLQLTRNHNKITDWPLF